MGKDQGKEGPTKKPQRLGQTNFLEISQHLLSASRQVSTVQQRDPLGPESFLQGDLGERGLG